MPYYPPAASAGVTSPVTTDPLTFNGALTFSKPTAISGTTNGLHYTATNWGLGSWDGTFYYEGLQGVSQGGSRLQIFGYSGIEIRGARFDVAPATVTRTASDPCLSIIATTAANKVTVIKGAASQTGRMLEVQDSTANALWGMDSAGIPEWVATANQQTTVGAAGAASVLPATPTKYFKIKDSAGTVLVIPAYAAS